MEAVERGAMGYRIALATLYRAGRRTKGERARWGGEGTVSGVTRERAPLVDCWFERALWSDPTTVELIGPPGSTTHRGRRVREKRVNVVRRTTRKCIVVRMFQGLEVSPSRVLCCVCGNENETASSENTDALMLGTRPSSNGSNS